MNAFFAEFFGTAIILVFGGGVVANRSDTNSHWGFSSKFRRVFTKNPRFTQGNFRVTISEIRTLPAGEFAG